MEDKGYTKLIELLERCGIEFLDSGDSKNNKKGYVAIRVSDNPEKGELVLYFNIDQYGNETFIRQEIT